MFSYASPFVPSFYKTVRRNRSLLPRPDRNNQNAKAQPKAVRASAKVFEHPEHDKGKRIRKDITPRQMYMSIFSVCHA